MPATSALARLPVSALESELRRRQRLVGTLQRRRERLAAKVEALDRQIHAAGGSANGHISRGPGRRPRNKTTLAGALAQMLKGKTMTVVDAAEAVKKSGYKTKSRSFRIQVNTALIKGAFKRVGRGEYTAK